MAAPKGSIRGWAIEFWIIADRVLMATLCGLMTCFSLTGNGRILSSCGLA